MFGFDLPFWLIGLLTGARKFIAAVFAFVTKPPGSYIALVALILLAWWWSGERGFNRGDATGYERCQAEHRAAAARERARQVKVGVVVTRASENRTTQSAIINQSNREIVSDVKARAEALPPPPAHCPVAVPADLADRLRKLE